MKIKKLSIDLNKLKKVEEINRMTQSVFENRKNVNNLVDLLDTIREDLNRDQNSDQKLSQLLIETTIRAVNKIFIRFIDTKEFVITSDESEANKTYKKWLIDVYSQTNTALIQIIDNNSYSKSTKKLSLNCLMKCVTEEGLSPKPQQ